MKTKQKQKYSIYFIIQPTINIHVVILKDTCPFYVITVREYSWVVLLDWRGEKGIVALGGAVLTACPTSSSIYR